MDEALAAMRRTALAEREAAVAQALRVGNEQIEALELLALQRDAHEHELGDAVAAARADERAFAVVQLAEAQAEAQAALRRSRAAHEAAVHELRRGLDPGQQRGR